MTMHYRTAAAILGALFLTFVCAGSATSAPEQAGVSAAVRGQVQRASDAQPVGVQMASGQPIYLADRISSGSDSGMQIMLMDQTTFTIGPDSFVKIDEFVYDPTTNIGKVTASLGKGVFRFVSGKIAQENPSNMTVKLPVATIGIRGTMVFGRSDQNSAVVGLAGAGPDNNTGDKPAGIDVITPQGTAEIRRPGWGVIIERGKPLVIGRLPKPTVDSIFNSVAPRELVNALALPGSGSSIVQASQKANVRVADNSSGQSSASSAPSMGTFQTGQSQQQGFIDTGGPLVLNNNGGTAFNFGDLTTFAQLNSVTTGGGFFSQTGIPLAGAGVIDGVPTNMTGSYNFSASIDFSNHRIAVNFANITVTDLGLSGESLSSGTVHYNALSAIPVVAGVGAFPIPLNPSAGCVAVCAGFASFQNAGGTVAKQAIQVLLVNVFVDSSQNGSLAGASILSR